MPEGPEICMASRFINAIGSSRLFGGRVVKSAVSTKNPDVDWEAEVYRVSAQSRGKELKVTVVEGEDDGVDVKGARTLDILFRFGMSGSFKYTPVEEAPKHAHLMFFTKNEEVPMMLCFVDYRRFGRWEVGGTWGKDRGPDPMWEYPTFRQNVLANIEMAPFKKPICEAMLNQKYFNGIGNYLRAEILYRCGVRPFDEARDVLSELKPLSKYYDTKTKCEVKQGSDVKLDFLDLCHVVPLEVINLTGGKGYNVDLDASEDEYKEFREWLQCYSQDGMNNLVDNNGRTIWFSGQPGNLLPKSKKTRARVERKKKPQKNITNAHEAEKENSDTNISDKKRAVKKEKILKKFNSPTNTTKSKQQSRRVKVKTALAKEQISKPDAEKTSAVIRKATCNSKNKPKSEKKVTEGSVRDTGMRRSTRLASRDSV